LNSPSHAALHQDVNDAVEKVQVKLGVGVSPASDASDGQVLMADGAGGTEWASITADEIDSTGQPAQRVLASDGSGGAGWVTNETGLVFINSYSTSSGTTISLNDCFNSQFENYKLIINNYSNATSNSGLNIRFGGNAAGYYFGLMHIPTNAGAGLVRYGSGIVTTTQGFIGLQTQSGGKASGSIDIFSPFVSGKNTHYTVTTGHSVSDNARGPFVGGGWHVNTSSWSSLEILVTGGAFQSLEARVYGYSN